MLSFSCHCTLTETCFWTSEIVLIVTSLLSEVGVPLGKLLLEQDSNEVQAAVVATEIMDKHETKVQNDLNKVK